MLPEMVSEDAASPQTAVAVAEGVPAAETSESKWDNSTDKLALTAEAIARAEGMSPTPAGVTGRPSVLPLMEAIEALSGAVYSEDARRLETVALRLSRAAARSVVRPCDVRAACTDAVVRTAAPTVLSTGVPKSTLEGLGTAQVPVRFPLP
jgi:hypothetical protein